MTQPPLPAHDAIGRLTRAVEAGSLVLALALVVMNLRRAAAAGLLHHWWTPLVAAAAALAADFVSGLVHWTADTWFSETMPVLGRRFLRPFRVHHVNPDDFLRRDFVDCNGDVAMLNIPILTGALLMPATGINGAVSIALLSFAIVSLPTNQVHQWAHMADPPRVVRWLQKRGVILGHAAHQQHHVSPYAMNYCIATGWCNRLLTRFDAFTRLERLVTALTGAVPREDDDRYASEPQA